MRPRYHEDGVRTVLVCCTGGEAGSILNPAMDTEEVRPACTRCAWRSGPVGRDHRLRRGQMLGWDSGCPTPPRTRTPSASPGRSRRGGRPAGGDHPPGAPAGDAHLRRRPGVPAPRSPAGPRRRCWPSARPPTPTSGAGEPWQVLKVYWSARGPRVQAMHEAFLDQGLESPFEKRWFERPRRTTGSPPTSTPGSPGSTLKAHATQIDPTSPFWFGLPDEVAAPCTRRTTSSSPAARCRRPRPRTISSPGYRSPCDLRSPTPCEARNGGAR